MSRKDEIAFELGEVRSRTIRLLDLVPDEYLKVRVHSFYSPIGWHFGHVGRTEEFWTVHKAAGRPVQDDDLSFLFADLPENPKDNRVNLPTRAEIVTYLEQTRARSLDALSHSDLDCSDPLVRDGYAWHFAAQHECQHQETICELLQLIRKVDHRLVESLPSFEPAASEDQMISIPGGTFRMGTDWAHAYDNEKQPHDVEVAPFELDRVPVRAADWMNFIEDGGYWKRELWTEAGWIWRTHELAEAPEYWTAASGGWGYFGPMGVRPLDPAEPVSSISWHEAHAYAEWALKRLPTEAEWEFAAAFAPEGERRRPWGNEPPSCDRASFGASRLEPGPVGSRSAGASYFGLHDMAGAVWEWTSTTFAPYPGFEPFPYDGYSMDHMDGRHYVCRGGSWASAATILRCTFRNWYVPGYRQGFLGLRCAR